MDERIMLRNAVVSYVVDVYSLMEGATLYTCGTYWNN